VVSLNLTATGGWLRSFESAAAGERRRPRDLRHRLRWRGAQGLLGAYAATKAALETLVRVYADEVASTKSRQSHRSRRLPHGAARPRLSCEKPRACRRRVRRRGVRRPREPACARHGELIVASKEGDHRWNADKKG